MNKRILKKAAILMMAVFLLMIMTAGSVLANDSRAVMSDPMDEKDFSSCRLLVAAEDASVFPSDAPILSSYNGTYLLQYDNPQTAQEAYFYYLEKNVAVDVDTQISICDEDDNSQGEENRMTQDNNPLSQLEEAVTGMEKGRFDVALIDTGANEEHVTEAVSMIGDDSFDHNGHGTKMAGFIAEGNSNVSILSIKAIGDDGRGDASAVYAAIEYAIAQDVRIISLSCSARTSDHQILREAIKRAIDQGIVFVGSAGNSGESAEQFVPGCIEAALIVGACDQGGKRLSSSNFGPTVDYYVAAESTSEAAARFSGVLSAQEGLETKLENIPGFLFLAAETMTEESDEPAGYCYFPGTDYLSQDVFQTNYSQQFYSVQGLGDDDVIYCTFVDNSWIPAYCIDHGKPNPNDDEYFYDQTTNNILGYLLRHGYPNTNWGLSWQEAQYLTQAAVFGAVGVPFYEVADGMHAPFWIWNHIWGDGTFSEGGYVEDTGHFQYAVELLEKAKRDASDSDAPYVNFWTPSSAILQRMITPARKVTSVTIQKISSASESVSSQLEGNAMYAKNCEGARFSVKIFDPYLEVWSAAHNYETGSDGTFTINGLHEGDKVAVEEAAAPKGYLLPPQKKQEITLKAFGNVVTFQDEPVFDSGTPILKKVKYQNQKIQEDQPLKGAIFQVRYYDNDSCSGNAKRTWYFQTGDDGSFTYDAAFFVQGYESSDLFFDTNNNPLLPLGSVLFTEIKSPQGYLNAETSIKAKITQSKNGGEAVFAWITSEGDMIKLKSRTATVGNLGIVLAVKKIDASSGKQLKNAKLQILDGKTVIAEWMSGATENILRGIFTPEKTYVLHEAKAPDGYQSAEDISFRFDKQGKLEVLSANADTFTNTDGISGIVLKDNLAIKLPVTGSSSHLVSLIAGSVLLLGGVFGLILARKKKKVCSIILCLVALVLMSIPTFAKGSLLIESSADQKHSYTVYQILSGEVLSNDILWDAHIAEDIPASLWDKLKVAPEKRSPVEIAWWIAESVRTDTDGSFAVRVAKAVLEEPSIAPDAFLSSGETITLPDGYYLIVSDDAQPMLLLAGQDRQVTIHEKSSVPTLTKEIGEVKTDGKILFGKAADSGIGKIIPYRLYGTLPSNYNVFDQYYYCFHDQFEKGILPDLKSLSVKLLDKNGKEKMNITASADICLSEQELTVSFQDLKNIYPLYSEQETILVEYEAFLTNEASIGSDSNDNDAWIEYTRSPICEKYGTSIPDRCHLYTWQLQLVKTGAESGNLLADAVFLIQDESGQYLNRDGTWSEKETDRSLWRTNKNGLLKVKYLDSGKFLITEKKAPKNYEPVQPFTVTISADYENAMAVVLTAKGEMVQGVDAQKGIVRVQVANRLIPPAPKTGDGNWTVFYLMLLGGSAFLFVFALAAKKIRKGNKK